MFPMIKGLVGLLAVAALSTGCSVGMAMSGKDAPNLGAFNVGSPRGQVELQLGSPVASTTDTNGLRTDVYEYELGNEPIAGRAVGHAVMDVLTLGLWEVVGTPIEAFQGQTRRVAITYDRQDRVLAFNNPT